jgi:hypothetical protein
MSPKASSIDAAVCVAPKVGASFRFSSTVSMDGAGADPPDADDRHVVARAHLRRVDGRSPASRHAAADEARLVEGDVVENLHTRRLIDDGVLGERAQTDHGVEVLAAGMVA